MISTTRFAALLSLALPFASANISFNSSFTYPGANSSYADFTITSSVGLSDSCVTAYAQSIPCDESLISGLDQSGNGPSEADKFSNTTLNALCTTQCIDGLVKWRDSVRSDCSSADVQKLDQKYSRYQDYGEGNGEGLMILEMAIQTNISLIDMLYWPTCIKDLNTGVFCYLDEDSSSGADWASSNDTENTPEIISTFCNSSCATQISVFTWDVTGKIYGTQDINIGDATKLCPKLDTSKFPFMESTNSSSSSSSSSSGNTTTTTGGTNSTRSNGTTIVGKGAAGVLRVESLVWGLSSTVVAVVVGLGML